jgi:hypothetical protein
MFINDYSAFGDVGSFDDAPDLIYQKLLNPSCHLSSPPVNVGRREGSALALHVGLSALSVEKTTSAVFVGTHRSVQGAFCHQPAASAALLKQHCFSGGQPHKGQLGLLIRC